jgi:hypothetical protein
MQMFADIARKWRAYQEDGYGTHIIFCIIGERDNLTYHEVRIIHCDHILMQATPDVGSLQSR